MASTLTLFSKMNLSRSVSERMIMSLKEFVVINERREKLFTTGSNLQKKPIEIRISSDLEDSEAIRVQNLVGFISKVAAINDI